MQQVQSNFQQSVENSEEWILVTGGFGYIGSHTILCLLKYNYRVLVIDNFSNCSYDCISRINKLTGKEIVYHNLDLKNFTELEKIFSQYRIRSVIHFAGYKSVSESVSKPLKYYENNVSGAVNLLSVMKKFSVKNIVFSSSATVYGAPQKLPITETDTVGICSNPYGRSKYFIEEILQDLFKSNKNWKISILRYFNPIGAEPSGIIGEDPKDIPNNLMPYITQVAVGRLTHLNVYGSDYPTKDGTGVRDYIHVMDLGNGHVKALEHMEKSPPNYYEVFNLGTGNGHSVLEIVNAFEKATLQKIPLQFTDRRSGDVAECYADVSKAKNILGWESSFNLEEMCRDSWNWQSKNHQGFTKTEE